MGCVFSEGAQPVPVWGLLWPFPSNPSRLDFGKGGWENHHGEMVLVLQDMLEQPHDGFLPSWKVRDGSVTHPGMGTKHWCQRDIPTCPQSCPSLGKAKMFCGL